MNEISDRKLVACPSHHLLLGNTERELAVAALLVTHEMGAKPIEDSQATHASTTTNRYESLG